MSRIATLDAPLPRRIAAGRVSAGAFWRALRPMLLVALPILLAGAALAFAFQAWQAQRDDRRIAALEAGRDETVGTEARPALMLARIRFLAIRDRIGETEPLIDALDRAGAANDAARARYLVGNARVRKAFTLIGAGDLDRAAPLVTLARQDYRRALQARPEFWDAKFNLDVASRLIRDYPEFDRKTGDEMRAEPKQIWTDIPGQPRGGP